MKHNEKSSFIGLIPLLIFVILYLGTGIFLQLQKVPMAFYQLPSPIAIFIGIIFAFLLFQGSIKEKFDTFLEGCGHQDIITMCVIYLLAGAFAGVTKTMGGVDSTVNLALSYIPVHFLAPNICSCCFYIYSYRDFCWCYCFYSSYCNRISGKKWSFYASYFSYSYGRSNVW